MQIVAVILLALLTAGVWFTDWRIYIFANDMHTELVKINDWNVTHANNAAMILTGVSNTSQSVNSIADTLAHGVDVRAKIQGGAELPAPAPIQPSPPATQQPAVQPPAPVQSPAPVPNARPQSKHHMDRHRQNDSAAEQLYQKLRRQRDEAESGVAEQKPSAQEPKPSVQGRRRDRETQAGRRHQGGAESKPEHRFDHHPNPRQDD